MTASDKMLELVAEFDLFEDDAFPWLSLDAARWRDNALELTLSLRSNRDDQGRTTTSAWRVTCGGVLRHSLEGFHGDDVRLITDLQEPLNAEQADGRSALYFNASGKLSDDAAGAVLGALFTAHRECVGNWIPFERYLNRNLGLHDLIASGDGLLAEGPHFLLAAYTRVLEERGIRPNLWGRSRIEPQSGESLEPRETCAAFLVDDAFVVARTFDAESL